jgi:polysaccharide export outer membrane protein
MTENRFGANVERHLRIRDSNKFLLLWSPYMKRLTLASTYVLITLLAGSTRFARAQQQSTGATSSATPVAGSTTSATSSSAETSDERYRIGPGDVLDIRVFNRSQLSRDAVRVDGRGVIRMPLIEGDIHAACRAEAEVADEIANRYLKYLRNPQVSVFVKEFQSQPVAVIGAVNNPGQFKLQRQVRLLELLTLANGPADHAGRTVQIIHAGGPSLCEKTATASPDDLAVSSFVSYTLSDTLQGKDRANPVVRPGDIVSVPDADQIYVVGNVTQPRAIPLKEPITVSRAIAMAGGEQRDTKRDSVRIVRQLPGSTTKQEIRVDLRAIEKQRAEDITLQANDIVDVPTSTGKSLLRSLMGTLVPSISQLPMRVIVP